MHSIRDINSYVNQYDIDSIKELELEDEIPVVKFKKIPKKKKKFDDGTSVRELEKKRIKSK